MGKLLFPLVCVVELSLFLVFRAVHVRVRMERLNGKERRLAREIF